jgi:hypothetical protein
MRFEDCLKFGKVKKTLVNTLRAKSLIKSSEQAIQTALIIPLKENYLKTIFRELYEGLREYIEAIGFVRGYKFLDHESITHFLEEILNEEDISKRFDRYRKLRNGINYYGNDIELETIQEAIERIPKIIWKLRGYVEFK